VTEESMAEDRVAAEAMADQSMTDQFGAEYEVEYGVDAGLLDPMAQGTRALELTSDKAFFEAMVDVEIALVRALVDAGMAPGWMRAVCDELTPPDLRDVAAQARGGGNPVIPLVAALRRSAESLRAGASDHLHVGATSQDIVDSAAMLVARSVCAAVLASLEQLGATLEVLVEEHRRTAMVGRTLGQHAAPTTFGFVVAGWMDAVTAAIRRLREVSRSIPLQYGGAVGDLAALAEVARLRGGSAHRVREAFAARVGLRLPSIAWHTSRAPVLELASALAGAVAAVGVFAVDVAALSRTEVAEVAEAAPAGSGGSSAMPHKSNPVTAVLVCAAARRSPHLLASLYASALAEDQRPLGAWHAEWLPLRELERIAVSATAGAATLASRLRIDADRMRTNLELTGGLVHSERVTTLLAAQLGRSDAVSLVREATAEVRDSGGSLGSAVDRRLRDGSYGEAARAAAAEAFGGENMVTGADDSIVAVRDAAIDGVLEAFRATVAAPASHAEPGSVRP
jgi:3-carboxy-cis,cis-muconate cycloisomerase